MASAYVIGEDALSCALGARLISEILNWDLVQEPINTGGITKLRSNMPRYLNLERVAPVICVADTDGTCVITAKKNLFGGTLPDRFFLRLAHPESESWIMADPDNFASFMMVKHSRIPVRPDDVADPKREVLNLAVGSRNRVIRQEVVSPRDRNKPGVGYNVHMCDFASRLWSPSNARRNSPSLERAIKRLETL